MDSAGNELLLTVRVSCEEALTVEGGERTVVVIPFTAEASGPLFTGHTAGPCADTQTVEKGAEPFFSARYILEGKDAEGTACRVFIENQGRPNAGLVPRIVTDSPLLRSWETADLFSTLEIPGDCVIIRIFRRA